MVCSQLLTFENSMNSRTATVLPTATGTVAMSPAMSIARCHRRCRAVNSSFDFDVSDRIEKDDGRA